MESKRESIVLSQEPVNKQGVDRIKQRQNSVPLLISGFNQQSLEESK